MRPTLILLAALIALISGGEAFGEQRTLNGQVLHKQGTAKPKPVKAAQVSIVTVGNPYTTGDDGGFKIVIPDAFQFGQTIRLHVKKHGWGIDTPEGGKFELPRELIKDIFILPEASPEFLSVQHIDEFLEGLPERTKTQVKPDGKREEVDPTQAVKVYASEHDLSYQDTLDVVENRVRFYEQSVDTRQRCLAALYRKDLERINTLCKARKTGKIEQLQKKRQEVQKESRQGAKGQPKDYFSKILVLRKSLGTSGRLVIDSPKSKSKQSRLDRAKQELVQLIEEVVGDFRLAGDAYFINYDFVKALNAYEQGLRYVSKEEVPTLWADLQILVGNANGEIGIRTRDAAIHQHLTAAIVAYRQALTVYTKDEFRKAGP